MLCWDGVGVDDGVGVAGAVVDVDGVGDVDGCDGDAQSFANEGMQVNTARWPYTFLFSTTKARSASLPSKTRSMNLALKDSMGTAMGSTMAEEVRRER